MSWFILIHFIKLVSFNQNESKSKQTSKHLSMKHRTLVVLPVAAALLLLLLRQNCETALVWKRARATRSARAHKTWAGSRLLLKRLGLTLRLNPELPDMGIHNREMMVLIQWKFELKQLTKDRVFSHSTVSGNSIFWLVWKS